MSEQVDEPDLTAARDYALARLMTELPRELHYHSLWHTQSEVAPRALWLAQREGLSPTAQALISTAALFHDIGFTETRAAHERVGARIAGQVLPTLGYTPTQIRIIQDIILATRIPQTPRTLLAQIVADADLDVLGREDFLVRNQALRRELAAVGATCTDVTWYAQQLQFLDQHHYFTKSARRDRATGKGRNRAALCQIIADCCPRLLQTSSRQPRLHGLAVPGGLSTPSPTSPFRDFGLVLSPSLR